MTKRTERKTHDRHNASDLAVSAKTSLSEQGALKEERRVCSVDSLRGLVKPRNLEISSAQTMRDAIACERAYDGLGVFDLAVEYGVDQLV